MSSTAGGRVERVQRRLVRVLEHLSKLEITLDSAANDLADLGELSPRTRRAKRAPSTVTPLAHLALCQANGDGHYVVRATVELRLRKEGAVLLAAIARKELDPLPTWADLAKVVGKSKRAIASTLYRVRQGFDQAGLAGCINSSRRGVVLIARQLDMPASLQPPQLEPCAAATGPNSSPCRRAARP